MKLNGIEWHTWHIRGIYVAYLPWKHLDVIWNRHFAPRVSQNGLDQSTPLTSRPLLKQQNQRRTYFRTYMMTFKSGRLLMIINDSQDAPCCSIKNDQNIYIYMPLKLLMHFMINISALFFFKKMGEIMGRSWEDHGNHRQR